MPPSSSAERAWLRHAELLRGRLNAHWWLSRFLPLGVAATIAFACVILWARRHGYPLAAAWVVYGSALLGAALIALTGARRHWIGVREALVRLELIHGLHNGLSAAQAGVAPWPEPPAHSRHGLAERWNRLATPFLLAALFLIASQTLPIQPARTPHGPVPQQPIAWTQVQSWIDTLRQEDFLDEQKLAALQQRLDELRNRPAHEWYAHGSLEAGDNLKRQTEQAIESLQNDLASADAALDSASKMGAAASENNLQQVQNRLGQSLKGLENGHLPLNRDLLQQLQQLDSSQIRQLSQNQIAQLRQKLKQGQAACSACQAGGVSNEALQAQSVTMQKNSSLRSGGIARGRDDAPLALKDVESQVEDGEEASLRNESLEHAAIGDAVGLTTEAPAPPQGYAGPAASGQAAQAGAGGETVWRQSLTPAEAEVLQRFFK